MQNDDKSFSFTYSAPTEAERREIESIRRQYTSDKGKEGKIERLRSLHAKVTGKATAISLALGVMGTLLFGGGMALVLEFGKITLGILLALLGVPPIMAAYPVYNSVMSRGKQKYGEEILRLSEEILGE